MIEASIARRYAKAMVEIAQDGGDLEPVRLQLEEFETFLKESSDLREVLANRFINVAVRFKIVEELSSKGGLSQEVVHFLKLLVKKGRMDLYPFIVESFRKFAFNLEGKIEATVTSASPIDDATTSGLSKILSQKSGKEVLIRKEIKPEVLGGLRILLGNEIYDGTIKHGLDRLTQKMKEAAFI